MSPGNQSCQKHQFIVFTCWINNSIITNNIIILHQYHILNNNDMISSQNIINTYKCYISFIKTLTKFESGNRCQIHHGCGGIITNIMINFNYDTNLVSDNGNSIPEVLKRKSSSFGRYNNISPSDWAMLFIILFNQLSESSSVAHYI